LLDLLYLPTTTYKIEHMGKERLERAGLLLTVINVVDPELVEYKEEVDDAEGEGDDNLKGEILMVSFMTILRRNLFFKYRRWGCWVMVWT
jgi:hypothetical protein